MCLEKEWQERFEKVWDPEGEGRYRRGSEGLRLVPYIRSLIEPQEINDYGSGTGRCAAELVRHGYRLNCVDIATNAMEEDAASLIGKGITFTHAPLWDLPIVYPKKEWGICLDVLMTIPVEKLDDTLSEISRTAKNLIVEVYNWQDRRLGYDLTATIMSRDEWYRVLKDFWMCVEMAIHPQTAARFLYVCRG